MLRAASFSSATRLTLGLAVLLLVPVGVRDAWATSPFEAAPLDLREANLRDLGVTDVNGDGALDIFTVSHGAPESVLLGDGAGGFTEAREALNLDNDARFEELAPGAAEPAIPGPGVLFFWQHGRFTVVAEGATAEEPVAVELIFLSRIGALELDAFDGSVEVEKIADGVRRTTLTLTTATDGRVDLALVTGSVPIDVEVSPGADRDVYVGAAAEPVAERSFQIWVGRDRHAMAWADVIGGRRAEAVIVRGGLRGRMDSYPFTFHEELRVWRDGSFQDDGPSRGLRTRNCSADSVTAVDATGDGRLDLHITCSHAQPDLLYVQRSDGRFVERAARAGLDVLGSRPTFWLDFDGDGDQDMLNVEGVRVNLYRNRDGSFDRSKLVKRPRGARIRTLIAGDADADGDTDVFLVDRDASVLLRNVGGDMVKVGARTSGLPRRLLDASFVDADADGRLDVYAVPGGLFRQRSSGIFAPTQLVPPVPDDVIDARSVWFDADGDGRRDLVRAVLTGDGSFPREWEAELLLNRLDGGHWSQIILRGPSRNRSAIGATVTVRTFDGVRTARVGDADSSHKSHGHHRLYFGLGDAERIERVIVRWPGGRTVKYGGRRVDRILTFSR